MRVSIVIPTFNRSEFLVEAVLSALAQDYADLEIIIADNASTDYTSDVANYFIRDDRVKYFRNEENVGMVRNWRQTIFQRATGEWFLILSDDDILTNSRFISQAVDLIRKNENISVVYSNSYVYDEGLNSLTKLKVPFSNVEDGKAVFSKRGTVRPQDFALCNVLFNRKLSMECDAFRNSSNLSCDTELFLRLCLRGDVGVIDEYSSIYRMHSGNLLKSASKNPDLVVGSLDSLLLPLLEARKFNIEPSLIKEFVLNSRIKTEVLVGLLKTSAISDSKARKLYSDLRYTLGKSAGEVLPSVFLFCLILLSANALTPLFALRRRALFLINSAKRFLFGRQIYFELLKQKVYIIE